MKPERKDLIWATWPFWLVFFCYNFISCSLLAYFGKERMHLYFNQFHNNFFDVFFHYFTDFATTYVFIILLAYLLYKTALRNVFPLVVGQTLAWAISTWVKRVFFKDVHRPTYYFSQRHVPLHLVDGVMSQIPYTFPSGHSLMAVSVYLMICLEVKNRWVQFIISLIFPLVCIGRIYLSKHFVLDTIGGSILGLMLFTVTYYLSFQLKSSFWDKNILDLWKKKS